MAISAAGLVRSPAVLGRSKVSESPHVTLDGGHALT